MSKIPFDQVNRLIDGSTGPYSTTTQKGRSANAGNEVANLFKKGVSLNNTDVKYAGIHSTNPYRGAVTTGTEYPNKVNISEALAYSTEALKGYDLNNDGIVYAADFGYPKRTQSTDPNIIGMPAPSAVGTTIDLNSDGKIDAGEMTAWTIYQDGQVIKVGGSGISMYSSHSVDGKVTAQEATFAKSELSRDPNEVKTKLQQIYNENNIAESKENFTMPPKRRRQYQPNPSPQPIQNSLMQMFQQLMQMLMSSFGGFNGGFGGGTRYPLNYNN